MKAVDFKDIVLTKDEKKVLRKLKENTPTAINEKCADSLLKYGLIDRIAIENGSYGATYGNQILLSDRGNRYKIWIAQRRLELIKMPILVAAITSLIIDGLQWLLPHLSQLLSDVLSWLTHYPP